VPWRTSWRQRPRGRRGPPPRRCRSRRPVPRPRGTTHGQWTPCATPCGSGSRPPWRVDVRSESPGRRASPRSPRRSPSPRGSPPRSGRPSPPSRGRPSLSASRGPHGHARHRSGSSTGSGTPAPRPSPSACLAPTARVLLPCEPRARRAERAGPNAPERRCGRPHRRRHPDPYSLSTRSRSLHSAARLGAEREGGTVP